MATAPLMALSLFVQPTQAAGSGLQPLPGVTPVVTCAAMRTAPLSGVADRPVHITTAAEEKDSQGRGYCKVEGYVEPAVRFELRFPVSGWTQRYVQIGCGGLCGSINLRLDDHIAGCSPAANGELALGATDMGHEGGMDGSWAADNAQAQIDFAYRGQHVTAVVAKALIKHYYGRPARFAYFSGCSDGGREALVEAQRFPQDFNGVTAGAPALNFTVQNSFYHAWNALSNTGPDGKPILTTDRLPLLHAAVLAACDAQDGVKDGVIADPRGCHFDPASMQCRNGQDRAQCLSATEVEATRRIYAGAHDTAGRKLLAGPVMPGAELDWAGVFEPAHLQRHDRRQQRAQLVLPGSAARDVEAKRPEVRPADAGRFRQARTL
jgi:feruloyl esterase